MPKSYFFFFLFICYGTYAQQTGISDENSAQKLIESEKLSNGISFYPNPVDDVLKIRSQGIKITKVEIFSAVGGKVKELKSNFKSIFLGDLTRGIYLIKIHSGKDYTVKKLIKK